MKLYAISEDEAVDPQSLDTYVRLSKDGSWALSAGPARKSTLCTFSDRHPKLGLTYERICEIA